MPSFITQAIFGGFHIDLARNVVTLAVVNLLGIRFRKRDSLSVCPSGYFRYQSETETSAHSESFSIYKKCGNFSIGLCDFPATNAKKLRHFYFFGKQSAESENVRNYYRQNPTVHVSHQHFCQVSVHDSRRVGASSQM